MQKRISLLFMFFLIFFSVQGGVKYASPLGNSTNTGNSTSQPWNLEYALGNPSLFVPGDSLILMDGVYEGNFESYLNGSKENPIVVISQNDGKAIIDAGKKRTTGTGLLIYGSYTWYVGLKVTSSTLVRSSDESNGFAEIKDELGITVFGDNIKIINCWVYDIVGGGIELWRNGFNNEVYGSVIFNNGSQGNTRGNGHGFYIQHYDENQPKIIENNIVFQNASQGINIYTTNPEVKGIKVFRNISFNTGVIANVNLLVHRPPHNFTVGSKNNLSSEVEVSENMFFRDLQGGRLNSGQVSNVTLGRTFFPNKNFRFTNNTMFGGRNQMEILPVEGLVLASNQFYNVHGNFYAIYGDKGSYPSSNWDLNQFFNLANVQKPFNGKDFESWKSEFGFDLNSEQNGTTSINQKVLITQNKYDPSKFYVTILKFDQSEIATLDFSKFAEFKGRKFKIIDFQNPFDADQSISGTLTGSTIQFPMFWNESLQPNGNMPFSVVHTDTDFGTFLLKFEESEPIESPVFKENMTLYLEEGGSIMTVPSEYFISGYSEEFDIDFSRSLTYSCEDLGLNEVIVKIKKDGIVKWDGVVKVDVIDDLPPKLEVKNFGTIIDIVSNKTFELKPEYFISSLSDNCGEDLEIKMIPDLIGCGDINSTVPIEVHIRIEDKSGNVTEALTFVTVDVSESKKVLLNGPSTGVIGEDVKLELSSEFSYTVLGWYKGDDLISSSDSKVLTVTSSGKYVAELLPVNGCPVFSQPKEIVFNEDPEPDGKPYPPIIEKLELPLNEDGLVEIAVNDIFQETLQGDSGLTISFDKNLFNCENIGENTIVVLIKDSQGNEWEEMIVVKVEDNLPPILETKNIEVEMDVLVGRIELNTELFISSISDNCGIEKLTLNKPVLECESLGKEVIVELRAEDYYGNVTEKTAVVTVKSIVSQPINIEGPETICIGEKREIELTSEAGFEVVRWRRNGNELAVQTGKTLEIEEGGVYHAVIRYEGGCLYETTKLEVATNDLPEGEIGVEGNELTAPEGDKYQWFYNGEEMEQTSQSIEVHKMGEYTVEVTNEVGCSQFFGPVEMTISGILGSKTISKEFKIYPNPVSSEVILEVVGDEEFENGTWRIYDSNGKDVSAVIRLNSESPKRIGLDASGIAAGTYLVLIKGKGQEVFLGRIIKIK